MKYETKVNKLSYRKTMWCAFTDTAAQCHQFRYRKRSGELWLVATENIPIGKQISVMLNVPNRGDLQQSFFPTRRNFQDSQQGEGIQTGHHSYPYYYY